MLIRKAGKGRWYIWENQNPLLPWLNVLFNKCDTDSLSGWRWKRWRSWRQCEKDWVDGPGQAGWMAGAVWPDAQNKPGTFTPSLPEPPGGFPRQTQAPLHYRWENKCLCGEQTEGGLFLLILRESTSTLPQPSAQKQHVAFKERSGKLQQLGSLN